MHPQAFKVHLGHLLQTLVQELELHQTGIMLMLHHILDLEQVEQQVQQEHPGSSVDQTQLLQRFIHRIIKGENNGIRTTIFYR